MTIKSAFFLLICLRGVSCAFPIPMATAEQCKAEAERVQAVYDLGLNRTAVICVGTGFREDR